MIHKNYDIVCVGGGLSGFAAALASAHSGMKTLLTERAYSLGGEAAGKPAFLTGSDQGNILGDLADELLFRLRKYHGCAEVIHRPGQGDFIPLNSEALKVAMMQMCREAGVELLFSCVPIQKESRNVFRFWGKGGQLLLEGKRFIDGTINGELASLAGAEIEFSGPAPASLPLVFSQVHWETVLRYAQEHPDDVQADPECRCLEGFAQLLLKCQLPFSSLRCFQAAEHGRTVVEAVRISGIDETDPESLSSGIESASLQALELYRKLQNGFPGFSQCRLSSVAQSLKIQGTRRFRCQAAVSLEECDEKALLRFPAFEGEKACLVPVGAWLPNGVDNLVLAGHCLSAKASTPSALYAEGVQMALGEAAGIYASFSVHKGLVSKNQLREELAKRASFSMLLV